MLKLIVEGKLHWSHLFSIAT